MEERELYGLIESGAGLRKRGEARRALGASLRALRCVLDDDDAGALAKALPPGLRHLLERPAPKKRRNVQGLYEEAQRREGVGLGFAMEHVQVVLQALAGHLDPELVARLRKHLPSDVAAILRPPRRFAAAPPPVHTHPPVRRAPRHTLSSAHPGAASSIADTREPLAHSSSVARAREPHAERMVETARSTRPGREDETLATAGRGESEPSRDE